MEGDCQGKSETASGKGENQGMDGLGKKRYKKGGGTNTVNVGDGRPIPFPSHWLVPLLPLP